MPDISGDGELAALRYRLIWSVSGGPINAFTRWIEGAHLRRRVMQVCAAVCIPAP